MGGDEAADGRGAACRTGSAAGAGAWTAVCSGAANWTALTGVPSRSTDSMWQQGSASPIASASSCAGGRQQPCPGLGDGASGPRWQKHNAADAFSNAAASAAIPAMRMDWLMPRLQHGPAAAGTQARVSPWGSACVPACILSSLPPAFA